VCPGINTSRFSSESSTSSRASDDELAIGFTIGLLHLLLWLAIVLIGAQAFLFAQIGMRLGAQLNESLREHAEQLAGLALIGLAVLLTVDKVT